MAVEGSFKLRWSVSHFSDDGPCQTAEALYRLTLEKAWPAAAYDTSFHLRLQSLEAIESLRGYSRRRWDLTVPLVQFRVTPQCELGKLQLIVLKKGYRLELEAWEPETLQAVSEKLGLEFKYHGELEE